MNGQRTGRNGDAAPGAGDCRWSLSNKIVCPRAICTKEDSGQFPSPYPMSGSSRESKDTHVSRDLVLASLAAGKNVTNDAGRGLLPRAPLAHHSQHSTQRDAVARAVLHRSGFAPASPSWAGGSVHGCQRSVVASSNRQIFWQRSILKLTGGVRGQPKTRTSDRDTYTFGELSPHVKTR